MGLLAAALDAFEDENERSDRLIKSGTLRTTRGTALVAVSVLSIMALLNELAPEVLGLDQLTATQKFYGSIAIGFVWAITAAADALARGIATKGSSNGESYAVALQEIARAGHASTGLRTIEPPLSVVLTGKPAVDERGWMVVASAMQEGGLQFCCVKGSTVEWVNANDASVVWTTADIGDR